MSYQPVIGLEIHVELKTKTKMFCSCRNNPKEQRPNINICPICLGHPGVLPVANKEAIRKVIKTGLALNCQIPEYSKFDRKNYFYPDLPKGYQISQYDAPLCVGGYLELPVIEENAKSEKFQIPNSKFQRNSKFKIQNSKFKRIRIQRVHLEEDTGKLLHEKNCSLVDFNRAGIPLMELVTEPDVNSAKEARRFAEELHLIMHYLDVSDADMEKGEMRIEVNISLRSENPNSKSQIPKLGTKVEIKNLNSFRAVERAIDYEIKRQTEILNSGRKVLQETRGWNDLKQITVSQREKEEAQDYRYFPEPDLPPLYFDQTFLNEIKAEIPELPQQRKERFKKEYKLEEKKIEFFVYNKNFGEYFEKTISELKRWVRDIEKKEKIEEEEFLKLTNLCSNYLITDLQGLLKGSDISNTLITPENFAEFITLIYQGKISSKLAKLMLEEMFKTGADPCQIIEEKGLNQITDETEIEKIVKEVISRNQKAVEDYKKGKENALQFLIGQIMSQTKGKVNPEIVSNLLKETLTKII